MSVSLARAEPGSFLQVSYEMSSKHVPATRTLPHQFYHTQHIKISNQSQVELSEVHFCAYGNRYRQALPYLNDLNFDRLYPKGISRHGVEILAAEQEGQGLSWSWLPHAQSPLYFSVQLQRPLAPQESTVLALRTRFDLPEKLGAYGAYGRDITLLGGWYPYVLGLSQQGEIYHHPWPPQAQWQVQVDAEGPALLGDQVTDAKLTSHHFACKDCRIVELRLFGKMHRKRFGHSQAVQVLNSQSEGASYHKSFTRLVQSWEEFLKQHTADTPKSQYTFVQAPLREFLVMQGEHVAFLSDRSFRLLPELHRYHAIPVVQSLFFQHFYPVVNEKESDADVLWVAEWLSWHWTDRFLRWDTFANRDARNIPLLKWFSFLPSIDLLIHSPQFAFVDTFYNSVYPWDPNRDQPARADNDINFGRTVYERMRDWLGDQQVQDLAQGYLNHPKSLRDMVYEAQPDASRVDFPAWIHEPKPTNYRFGKVKSQKTSPETYHHEIQVLRSSRHRVKEPVEIQVSTRDREKNKLIWFDEQPSHNFELSTKSPLRKKIIDPRGRLLETRLDDNQIPPQYKVVLEQLILDFDFNEREPVVVAGAQIRRKHGGMNRYTLGASYVNEAYGFYVGYRRLFGRLIDRIRLAHGLGLSFGFSHTLNDYALASDGTSVVPVAITPGQEITSLSLGYFFGNQQSFTNPLQGNYGGISTTWGTTLLGGDSNYYKVGIGAAGVIPLSKPNHLFALRFSLNTSGPQDMPSQVQNRLGGLNTMRGLSFSEDRYMGRHLFLLSGEYRSMVLRDIDVNAWLFRLRKVQLALFGDMGQVAGTVQERANFLAFDLAQDSDFWDVFSVRDFKYDWGLGLRFHVDYFGVNPNLIRLDVAKGIGSTDEGLRFYFGVTQSF